MRTDFKFQVSREVFSFWIGVLTAAEDSLFPILEYSQVKKYCILGYLLPIFSTLNNAKEFSFMWVRFSSFTQKNSYIYPSDKKCCIPYLLRSHSGFLCFHQKLQIGKDKKLLYLSSCITSTPDSIEQERKLCTKTEDMGLELTFTKNGYLHVPLIWQFFNCQKNAVSCLFVGAKLTFSSSLTLPQKTLTLFCPQATDGSRETKQNIHPSVRLSNPGVPASKANKWIADVDFLLSIHKDNKEFVCQSTLNYNGIITQYVWEIIDDHFSLKWMKWARLLWEGCTSLNLWFEAIFCHYDISTSNMSSPSL